MANRIVLYTDTLQTFFETYNLTSEDVGDIVLLKTAADNLTQAVNEVHDEHDALDARVGPLSKIHAAVRGVDVTASVDTFYDSYIGWAAPAVPFSTTAQTATGALNELHGEHDALDARVGPLSSVALAIRGATATQSIDNMYDAYFAWAAPSVAFNTTAQTATGALNELHGQHDSLDSWVGPRSFTFTGGLITGTSVRNAIQNSYNDLYAFVGRGVALSTTTTTNIVAAVNTLDSEKDAIDTRVGSLGTISAPVVNTSIVNAINSVYSQFDSRVGSLGNLNAGFTGINNDSVVNSLNYLYTEHVELDGRVGLLSSLSSEFINNKSNIVAAINYTHNQLLTRDGDLGTLKTVFKTNLVGALNEVHDETDTNTASISAINTTIGSLASVDSAIRSTTVSGTFSNFYSAYAARASVGTSLLTASQTLGGAINEIHGAAATTEVQKDAATLEALHARTGLLSGLAVGFTGANDDSLVSAINYVYGLQTGTDQEFTNASVTGTLDVGGMATLSGGLLVDGGTFGSRGISDNATSNRLAIENASITLKTATTVQGNLTSTGDLAGVNGRFGANSFLTNQAGEQIEFSNTASTVAIVTSAATRALFGANIDLFRPTTVSGTLTVTGAATVQGGAVWHAGNDGPGSGLNADLLDGVQLTNIARTDISETFNQNLVVNGNLTVLGTTTTNDQESLLINDNKVVLNSNVTGTPTLDAFFEVERGTSPNTSIRWNETGDFWDVTNNGTVWYRIITTADEGPGAGFNADLLDSQHGAYYLNWNNFTNVPATFTPSAHTHAASDITSGTLAVARIPSLDAGKITTGVFADARIPSLDAGKITTGVFADARLPTTQAGKTFTSRIAVESVTGRNSGLFLTAGEFAAEVEANAGLGEFVWLAGESGVKAVSSSDNLATGWLGRHEATVIDSAGNSSFPGTLTAAGLTVSGAAVWHTGNLDPNSRPASSITSGTFADARIPNLNASKITAGTFPDARIASVGAAKITSGTLNLSGDEILAQRVRFTNLEALNLTVDGQLIWDLSDGFYYRASATNYIIWSSQNHGSGSGLNADLLDGQHATAFAAASHNHDASNITTGTLNSARLPDLVVADFSDAAINTSAEAFSYSNSLLPTTAAVEDRILSKGYTNNTGTITGVTAGNGLTGGGSSGAVALSVGAGTGISVAATSISVNMGAFSTSNLSEGSNLYYTTARANSAIDTRVTQAYVNALNINAATLGGVNSSGFLRSNTAATATGKITLEAGARLNDGDVLEFGSSADLEMFHNGGHAYIDINLGNIYVRDNITTRFTFERGTGNFTATGNITAYSDRRLKTQITPMVDGLSILAGINPVYYRWNKEAEKRGLDSERQQVGVIAQEVEHSQPEAVHENEAGDKLVAYEKLIPALIASIKQLEARVKELEKA